MVLWNVTLFSVLVAASCLEILLCGVQLVNASIGVLCGDCRKKQVGRCGMGLARKPICSLAVSGPHFVFSAGLLSVRLHPPGPWLLDTHLTHPHPGINYLEYLEFSSASQTVPLYKECRKASRYTVVWGSYTLLTIFLIVTELLVD